jgi:hypothetical protein
MVTLTTVPVSDGGSCNPGHQQVAATATASDLSRVRGCSLSPSCDVVSDAPIARPVAVVHSSGMLTSAILWRYIVALLLKTLLFLRPGPQTQCIEHRFDQIVAAVTSPEVQLHAVPPAILLVVAFAETHIGCDRGEGGGWGAPISRAQRHVAGTPATAASSLANGAEHCMPRGFGWDGAVAWFRCGLCLCPGTRRGQAGADVLERMALIRSLYAAAAIHCYRTTCGHPRRRISPEDLPGEMHEPNQHLFAEEQAAYEREREQEWQAGHARQVETSVRTSPPPAENAAAPIDLPVVGTYGAQ